MLCGSNSLPVSDHLEDRKLRLIKQQHACEAHRGFVKTEIPFSTSTRNQGVVLLFVCVWGGGACACLCVCMHVCVCAHTRVSVCAHVCVCAHTSVCV